MYTPSVPCCLVATENKRSRHAITRTVIPAKTKPVFPVDSSCSFFPGRDGNPVFFVNPTVSLRAVALGTRICDTEQSTRVNAESIVSKICQCFHQRMKSVENKLHFWSWCHQTRCLKIRTYQNVYFRSKRSTKNWKQNKANLEKLYQTKSEFHLWRNNETFIKFLYKIDW